MFPIHHKFPNEMAIVGRIQVDYGEIEIDLLNCIQMARGGHELDHEDNVQGPG